MSKSLFEKIIDREIPAEIVMENDEMIVIHDINPQAPVHVLLIPKLCIPQLNQVREEHQALLGALMRKVPEVAEHLGIKDDFRVVINNGAQAGQTVFHLHVHILGGRSMQWPPG